MNTKFSFLRYNIDVILPENVYCERCVFKWRYHAGNGWGCNAPDDCGIGKGPQEEFHNCADIQIFPDVGGTTPKFG